MVELLLKRQDKKPCQLENQILKQEVHLGQDTIAQTPDLKQWLDIGLVRNGNMYNKIKHQWTILI